MQQWQYACGSHTSCWPAGHTLAGSQLPASKPMISLRSMWAWKSIITSALCVFLGEGERWAGVWGGGGQCSVVSGEMQEG
jgi:hypothetical protein